MTTQPKPEKVSAPESATNLMFIGDRFYWDSGTSMSSLYTTDGRRYDWGFVQRDLAQGKEVHIRPATESELVSFKARLLNIKGAQL